MASSEGAILEFNNVSFGYGEGLILCDVTFSVDMGEFIGIIGPNGGGKTTLLKLILSSIAPLSGKVSLFGAAPEENLRRIGYVPQCLGYDKKFPISVEELVLSGLLSQLPWYGLYSKAQKVRAAEAMDKVGVLHLAKRPIGSLSGGQMQRALIARALVAAPSLLLLDEPTANIDQQAEREIFALLRHLAGGEVTILMVTHDLNASIEQVDRVLCVQGGVTSFKTAEVCEHFALGLYHAPLLQKNEEGKGCILQKKQERARG